MTKKKSSAASSLVLALLVAGFAADCFPSIPAAYAAGNDCTSQTDPFTVTGAAWGTPGSPASAYPGAQSVPLTVTLLFSGPCSSPQTIFFLGLAQGTTLVPFTGQNGNPQPTDIALNITPNSLVTETFYLNVNQDAAIGVTYNIPLIIQYADNSLSNIITQTGSQTNVPIALYGPVQLAFAADSTHLSPGEVNNVTLKVSNVGSGAAGPVSTTVTAPSGVVVLNQLPATAALSPGASASEPLQVFVPSSMAGTALVLTFVSKYLDPYSNGQSVTNTLGFVVSSLNAVQASSAFVVAGASWGSASSSSSPLPGTQNQPLVVTLQYLGSAAVTSLEGTLSLPSGVTDLNGRSTAGAFSSAPTNQYGTVTLTFNLDIASTASPGNYNFTLDLSWMTSQSAGLTQATVVTPPPIASLESSFVVEGSTWQKAASTNGTASSASTSPVPGSMDAPLVVSLQYLGAAGVTSLKGTLSLPSGVTDLNGQPTATAYSATAAPGQVVTLTFDLNVGSEVSPGSYSYSLDLSWTSNSVGFSQSASLSPPPIASPASTTVFQLSVSQLNSTVVAGEQTSAGFRLTNGGTSTIYSPTFSLTATNPVVVSSVDSSIPASLVGPGASATFVAHLTSSPSASPGIYGSSLTVTFTDSSGTTHTQSFPVSFTLEGTVTLVLQDTSVSQSLTGFTVTGSILNEGSVAAYYASISGLLGTNAGTAAYIGEIDPNSPTTFSVTIPYPAPAATATNSTNPAGGNSTAVSTSFTFTRGGSFTFGGFPPGANFTRGANGTLIGGFPGARNQTSGPGGSASIALTITYKDTFDQQRLQAFGVPTTIRTASQLSSGSAPSVRTAASNGTNVMTYAAYGVVATFVAVGIAGVVMLRRYRARRLATLPAEGRGDQSVI